MALEFSDVALKMMWKIKSEFDPDNIMNPGKKLPTRKSDHRANGAAQD
jgi:FAD/FMN-containing dehydrogenase